MKKIKRLTEIKRQLGLAQSKVERATRRCSILLAERRKVVASLTIEEKRLYKERIERACR